MELALWIAQIILAVMFGMAGIMKSTQPKEKLAKGLPWTTDVSTPTVRIIGISELLGALGLILPAATGILPILTPIAATGLAVIMVLAIVTHARRKESQAIVFTVVLLAVSAFVALGRFGVFGA